MESVDQKIARAQELMRQTFAILNDLAAQNADLKLLAAKPPPQPLPIIAALPEPPEQDE